MARGTENGTPLIRNSSSRFRFLEQKFPAVVVYMYVCMYVCNWNWNLGLVFLFVLCCGCIYIRFFNG